MRVNAHSSAGYILIPDLDAIRAAVALLLAPESSSSVAP
jgi:hypothetical protein